MKLGYYLGLHFSGVALSGASLELHEEEGQ